MNTDDNVAVYYSTEKGKISHVYSDSDIATSYAMTMKFGPKTKSEFTAKYRIKSFAKLEDGTLIYSKPVSWTIFDVAEKLYINREMSSEIAHNYLYNSILLKVNPAYETVEY